MRATSVADEDAWRVVLGHDVVRPVKLPQIFEAGRGLEGLERFDRAALARAVVHDRHARCNACTIAGAFD